MSFKKVLARTTAGAGGLLIALSGLMVAPATASAAPVEAGVDTLCQQVFFGEESNCEPLHYADWTTTTRTPITTPTPAGSETPTGFFSYTELGEIYIDSIYYSSDGPTITPDPNASPLPDNWRFATAPSNVAELSLPQTVDFYFDPSGPYTDFRLVGMYGETYNPDDGSWGFDDADITEIHDYFDFDEHPQFPNATAAYLPETVFEITPTELIEDGSSVSGQATFTLATPTTTYRTDGSLNAIDYNYRLVAVLETTDEFGEVSQSYVADGHYFKTGFISDLQAGLTWEDPNCSVADGCGETGITSSVFNYSTTGTWRPNDLPVLPENYGVASENVCSVVDAQLVNGGLSVDVVFNATAIGVPEVAISGTDFLDLSTVDGFTYEIQTEPRGIEEERVTLYERVDDPAYPDQTAGIYFAENSIGSSSVNGEAFTNEVVLFGERTYDASNRDAMTMTTAPITFSGAYSGGNNFELEFPFAYSAPAVCGGTVDIPTPDSPISPKPPISVNTASSANPSFVLLAGSILGLLGSAVALSVHGRREQ